MALPSIAHERGVICSKCHFIAFPRNSNAIRRWIRVTINFWLKCAGTRSNTWQRWTNKLPSWRRICTLSKEIERIFLLALFLLLSFFRWIEGMYFYECGRNRSILLFEMQFFPNFYWRHRSVHYVFWFLYIFVFPYVPLTSSCISSSLWFWCAVCSGFSFRILLEWKSTLQWYHLLKLSNSCLLPNWGIWWICEIEIMSYVAYFDKICEVVSDDPEMLKSYEGTRRQVDFQFFRSN